MLRITYDLTMAALILGVGTVVLLGDKLKINRLIELDPLMRYMFGGICLLYGGFRLYRGLKRDRY